jgi:hypothetical protein
MSKNKKAVRIILEVLHDEYTVFANAPVEVLVKDFVGKHCHQPCCGVHHLAVRPDDVHKQFKALEWSHAAERPSNHCECCHCLAASKKG